MFSSEFNQAAQEVYNANYGEFPYGDITKIPLDSIPHHDVLAAGFPCQPFSISGKMKGFEDTRGTLIYNVFQIIQAKEPQVVFLENVKHLIHHNSGHTLQTILAGLGNLGYKTSYTILNASDFGVPQNRERIYIVAFRNDIAPKEFIFPAKTDDTKRIRDVMEENPVPAKYYLSTCYMDTLIRHKERHAAKGHGFGYEIRDLDDVSGAIVCGGMGRERNLIIDKRQTNLTSTTHIKGEINKDGIRKMTPREWARLQGFPDDYKLVLADVHLYKQFGNSVTVPVIQAIAEKIKEVLDKNGRN